MGSGFPDKDEGGVTEIAKRIKTLMRDVDESEWVEDIRNTRKEK